jgi:hypothetical protein
MFCLAWNRGERASLTLPSSCGDIPCMNLRRIQAFPLARLAKNFFGGFLCGVLLFLFAPAIRLPAQSLSITNFSVATNGTRVIIGEGFSTNYYLLYSGSTLTNISTPVAVLQGTNGPCILFDNYPQSSAQFYRVLTVPAGVDSDGDGIPDALELMYPSCLNPYDATDASADCDGDGLSNSQEIAWGSDPSVPDRLLINEIDYDQIGTDTAEFVELYNPGTQTINLDGTAMVFINGNNGLEYFRTPLSGTLAPGQYLVAGSTNVVPAPGSLFVHFSLDQNAIQNGAPDGVLVINTRSQTVLDSFSYEGPINHAVLNWFSRPLNLVRGTVLASGVADSNVVNGSLARLPNGASTYNDNDDWSFTGTPTPGAANVP